MGLRDIRASRSKFWNNKQKVLAGGNSILSGNWSFLGQERAAEMTQLIGFSTQSCSSDPTACRLEIHGIDEDGDEQRDFNCDFPVVSFQNGSTTVTKRSLIGFVQGGLN
jgi:hypothetical protein